MPVEYIELVLCRDIYHCRPSELESEDFVTILKHLTCLDVEHKVQDAKMQAAKKTPRGRRRR